MKEKEVKKFWEDGYIHIKSVFTKEEVLLLRKKLEKSQNLSKKVTSSKNDLLSQKYFDDLLLDERIISRIKSILGGQIIYFGDSSWIAHKYDSKQEIDSYHTDNSYRFRNGPDWSGKYPIIRFGLFLQDHKKQGGGILFNRKSHNRFINNRYLRYLNREVLGWINGNSKYMATEVGDLLIWNLKLSHAGRGQYLKYFFKKPVSRSLSKIIPKLFLSKYNSNRFLVTGTFGLEGEHLQTYIQNLKTRKYMVNQWMNDSITNDNLEKIKSKGIKYYDMKKQVLDDLSKGLLSMDKLKDWHEDPE